MFPSLTAANPLMQRTIELRMWAEGHARAISVVLALLLAVLGGASLSWSWWWIVACAAMFAVLVLVAQSLFRAVGSLIASLGIVAGGLWLFTRIWPEAISALHVTTGVAAGLMAATALLCAVCWRAAEGRPSYSLQEALGAAVGIAFAARMLIALDTRQNLLRFLVHVEDNAAWVSLTRDVATARFADADLHGSLGPSIPLALGALSRFQGQGVPMFNATFAAYALAIFALPIVVAGLFGGRLRISTVASAALFMILLTWAYRVPFLLFASYGHLSAIWAFLVLVVLAALWIRIDRRAVGFVPATGLALVLGTLWFPLAGLAIVSAWCAVIFVWCGFGTLARAGSVVVATAATYVLAAQIPLGLAPGGGAADAVATLYNAQGGTAALDTVVVAVVLGGVVSLGWLGSGRIHALSRAWAVTLIGTIFIGFVFAGAYALRLSVGYGPTKVLFIVGMAMSVVLIAMVARVTVPEPKAMLSVLAVLAMASLFYGGMPDVLSRNWPGDPDPPSWLMPLEKVVDTVGVESPAPIACVSSGKWPAYLCTRWAAALTASDDSSFLGYRIAVANDQDPGAEVRRAADDGVLQEAIVIELESLPPSSTWVAEMLKKAAEVYGPEGVLVGGGAETRGAEG